MNIVIGEAFGSAYLAMNSKSTGADMVFAWPGAQIGMMDARLAAKIMYADSDAATINEKLLNMLTYSQVPCLLPREAMWIPSLRQKIQENM